MKTTLLQDTTAVKYDTEELRCFERPFIPENIGNVSADSKYQCEEYTTQSVRSYIVANLPFADLRLKTLSGLQFNDVANLK